jgi:hypothetical protein
MILVLHLVFAFGSMAYATFLFFVPSHKGMRVTYVLVGLTFVSGLWLVITTAANMSEACITGLVYVGYVSYALVSSRNKLAKAEQRI